MRDPTARLLLALAAAVLVGGMFMLFARRGHGHVTAAHVVETRDARLLVLEEGSRRDFRYDWHYVVVDLATGQLRARIHGDPLYFVGATNDKLWFFAITDGTLGLHARAPGSLAVLVSEGAWRDNNPGFVRAPKELPWLNRTPRGIGLLRDDGRHVLLDPDTLLLTELTADDRVSPPSATRLDRHDADTPRVQFDARRSASFEGSERMAIHCDERAPSTQTYLDPAFLAPEAARSALRSTRLQARLVGEPPFLVRHRASLSSPLLAVSRTGCGDEPAAWTAALGVSVVRAVFFEPDRVLLIVGAPGSDHDEAVALQAETGVVQWRTPL